MAQMETRTERQQIKNRKGKTKMKKLKWIVELVKELARGLTQSGRIEILPDDNKEENNE